MAARRHVQVGHNLRVRGRKGYGVISFIMTKAAYIRDIQRGVNIYEIVLVGLYFPEDLTVSGSCLDAVGPRNPDGRFGFVMFSSGCHDGVYRPSQWLDSGIRLEEWKPRDRSAAS
jgi:hypothetical protein